VAHDLEPVEVSSMTLGSLMDEDLTRDW
ncbi:MAG: hypothetical protein ACJATP_002421, partial [Candidatus Azotimanducaceae bacterium]